METKNQKKWNPIKQINGWPDILAFHKTTQEEFDKKAESLWPHEVGRREAEMIIAAYNGRQLSDPLPEYGPGTESKLELVFSMPNASGAGFSYLACVYGGTYSLAGARLALYGPDKYDNARDIEKKFLASFEKAMTL